MGGPGSGRWDWHTKAHTVEACLTLDANRLTRFGVFNTGAYQAGKLTWAGGKKGENGIGYEACTPDGADPWLRLRYTFAATGAGEDYRVRLTTTQPRFGGRRWWFVCPLILADRPCERRVGKLYLPPGGRYFGCRRCYRLTYTSCQAHDKRVDALLRDPGLRRAAVHGPTNVTLLGVGLRALDEERRQREKRERRQALYSTPNP
jgi:hypothetical protein